MQNYTRGTANFFWKQIMTPNSITQKLLSVRYFFDLICPNSWLGYLTLRQRQTSFPFAVDFLPVCDFKIKIFQAASRGDRIGRNGSVPRESWNVPEEKTVFENKTGINFPDDYKQIHSKFLHDGSMLPMAYLSAVKIYKPHFFHAAIEALGHRVWRDRLPVHSGAYLSTVSREIGMEFRESEFIVSHLSHRHPRHYLDLNSRTAFQLGATRTPLLVVTADEEKLHCFEDFNNIDLFLER